MTRILFGDRICKQGKIRLGCSAVLFDEKREKVLLTRRGDTGQGCLPSLQATFLRVIYLVNSLLRR